MMLKWWSVESCWRLQREDDLTLKEKHFKKLFKEMYQNKIYFHENFLQALQGLPVNSLIMVV